VHTIPKHFNLTDAKAVPMPMEVGCVLSTEQSPSTLTELTAMQNVPYQWGIGSLMYVATSTQPDIAFAMATLSQFMRNPGTTHWEACKCVMRYLKGTADFALTLGSSDGGLKAYVDADWASQPHHHSMLGFVVLLNRGPVAWSARNHSSHCPLPKPNTLL
jgi:hypothetical protein